ncbi:MAG: META domain-containing protein [Prevotellaceae bacterium]|jgi:heat shock protein HslJ|nr:META domain-containing protein [Prevotellaceae bacterium]
MKKILFVLIPVILLASCKGKNAVPDQTLLNTRWILETIGEETIDNSNEDRPVYLFMEDGSHQLNGFAGCNGFFGSYLVGEPGELMFVGNRPQLLDTKWLLTAIGEEKVENANKENPIYIQLEEGEEGNRVAGMAGCNRYFGEFTEADNSGVSFSKMGSTRMMCQNMETETKYLNALSEVDSYHVDGLYLHLNNNGNTILTYKVDEESIKFSVASTMMMCQNMEVENKFHKVLAEVRKYDVDGLRLYLMDVNGKQLLGFKAFYEE